MKWSTSARVDFYLLVCRCLLFPCGYLSGESLRDGRVSVGRVLPLYLRVGRRLEDCEHIAF